MELPAGVGEEPREVTHALEVSHSHRAPLELQRPVVALATKDAEVCGSGSSVLPSGDVRRWVRHRRGFDPLEDRARRLALDVGLLLAAAGPEGFGEAHDVRAPLHRAPRPRSRVALPRRRTVPRPRRRPPRAAPFLEQGWRRRPAPCCGIGRRRAAVPRRLSGLDRGCRPRSRSRPAPRAAAPAAARCPVAAPSMAPGEGARARFVSRPPPWRCLLGPVGPARDRAAGPTRPVSGQQCLLGAFDVSLLKPDPSELGEGPSQFASQVRA